MSRILAIDPGTEKSAVVVWDGATISHRYIASNEGILLTLATSRDPLLIEQVRGFGLKAGNELFDTCWWAGRFFQQHDLGLSMMVPRKTVVQHHCNTARAGDTEVRQALIYRFGPPGTKKSPGLLHGVVKDEWSALALAVWGSDTELGRKA